MSKEVFNTINTIFKQRGKWLSKNEFLPLLESGLSPVLKRDFSLIPCNDFVWSENINLDIRKVFGLDYFRKWSGGKLYWGLFLPFVPSYRVNYDKSLSFKFSQSFKSTTCTIKAYNLKIDNENLTHPNNFNKSLEYILYFDSENFPKLLDKVYNNSKQLAETFYKETDNIEKLTNYIKNNLSVGYLGNDTVNDKRIFSRYNKYYILMFVSAKNNNPADVQKYFSQWISVDPYNLIQHLEAKKIITDLHPREELDKQIYSTQAMLKKHFGLDVTPDILDNFEFLKQA